MGFRGKKWEWNPLSGYPVITTKAPAVKKSGRETKEEKQSWVESGSMGGVEAGGLVLILNINTNLVSCLALQRFIDCSPHTNLLHGPGKTTSNTLHFLSCDSWKIIIPMKFICPCQCAVPTAQCVKIGTASFVRDGQYLVSQIDCRT